jgi:hypothetical protein
VIGGAEAHRQYLSAGAYLLEVVGKTNDLVPFLFAHLLTLPGMVGVRRCERRDCDHFFFDDPNRRGAPQRFCSDACRDLNAAQKKLEASKPALGKRGRK